MTMPSFLPSFLSLSLLYHSPTPLIIPHTTYTPMMISTTAGLGILQFKGIHVHLSLSELGIGGMGGRGRKGRGEKDPTRF